MAEKLTMPKLGFDMKEGTLANWVKKEGDHINSGDVIVEVETDKATVEVEAYATGTILKVLVQPGDIVEVGEPIAIIGEPGESIGDLGGETASANAAPAETKSPPPAAGKEPALADKDEDVAAKGGPKEISSDKPAGSNGQRKQAAEPEDGKLPGGVKASPVARRVAEDRGVDLQAVEGTGPGGRIIKRDVEGFTPSQKAAPTTAPQAAPAAAGLGAAPSYGVMDGLDYEEIPVSRLRSTIARRMVESKQWVPHFMVTMDIDVSAMLDLRKQVNTSLSDEEKVTVNDLIVKATALALRKFPNLNTHYHGDKLIRYKDINIGIAVALPQGGLMNVVVRNADRVSLSEIARKTKEMVGRAREGKVKGDDIDGSTFTVSNLGAYGVDHFTAIINPPEAGILAIGAAKQTPVVINGELGIANRMKVTLSVDHRVSDGAEGAQFVAALKELIENPMRLLI